MNKVIRIDYDNDTIYLTCHTDGDPQELFWVWEITDEDMDDYFNGYTYRADIHNLTIDQAETFANDTAILEDSDEYECGKSSIYGIWYAPLTMEQIERSLS